MGPAFWIRRFVLVWTIASVLIAGVQALKGHDLAYSLTQGLLWATISAVIFIAARLYQSRRGQHCAICRDTPEMRGQQHLAELESRGLVTLPRRTERGFKGPTVPNRGKLASEMVSEDRR